MAYGSKYHVIHKTKTGNTTYRIELQQNGFAGSSTEIRGTGDIFTHEYEKIDPREPFKNPIQKSRLELHLFIQDSSDLAILQKVFGSDEDEYRLVKKVNGSTVWTGKVLPDMLEYSEGPYPFQGTIVAKDLSSLSGTDFVDGSGNLIDDRVTIITTIADLLDDLGLGLDIYTYTSWINQNTTDTDDFLNQIYNERKALRDFANTGDETDQPITLEDALQRVLRNYGLILRQAGNAWRIYQLSELEDPTSVHEFQYDSTGTQIATATSKDITVDIDRISRFILPSSVNQVNPGVKKVKGKFDHRTKINTIKFPSVVELDGANPTESFSQFFTSDGDQKVRFSANAEAEMDDTHTSANILYEMRIEAGGTTYYYDKSSRTWGTSFVANSVSMTDTYHSGSKIGFSASVSVETTEPPVDADGSLVVELYVARDGATFADFTDYTDLNIEIRNAVATENSTSIDYELTQSGNYSVVRELESTIFGDGPIGYSPAALRYGTGDGQTTNDSWQRRGSIAYRNFHENLLKEHLDLQRSATRNLQGDLLGAFNPVNVPVYNTANLFFLGGTLTGKSNTWDGHFLEISVATGIDTFDDILDFDSSSKSTDIANGATYQIAKNNRAFNDSSKITSTTSTISGTVTSIPIEPVNDKFITVGDTFYVFDIFDGGLTSFVLAEPQQPGDTNLSAESKVISGAIPIGSWVIFNGEKISTYITRTDNAIRLGVNNYEQAVDEDGEALVDEDGEEIMYTGEDDGSTLALLQEQVILKVQNDGKIAAIRMDTSAEKGSVIDISADQVKINNATFDDEAGTFTLGTGNNVIVLDANDQDYRIYVGNTDPAQAPFRVKQDGTVEATKVVALKGSVDGSGNYIGAIDQLQLKKLEVTDTVTIETGEVKTIDTKTIDSSDFDVTTSLKDGELTFTINNTATALLRDIKVRASSDSNPNPEIVIEDENGNKTTMSQVAVTVSTGSAADNSSLTGDGTYCLQVGSSYVNAPSISDSGEYLKILAGGNIRYLKLYG